MREDNDDIQEREKLINLVNTSKYKIRQNHSQGLVVYSLRPRNKYTSHVVHETRAVHVCTSTSSSKECLDTDSDIYGHEQEQ